MKQIKLKTGLSIAILCLASPSSVYATTIRRMDFICSVGGEKFEASEYGSLFLYGNRPDGMPLGTMRGYVAIPECPGNRLVMYRDFTTEEVERLSAIVSSSEYQSLIVSETAFYRAAWLEKALKPASSEYVWLLLQATWYADSDHKARYQKAFLAVAETASADSHSPDTVMLRLRVLNVYREQAQFDRVMTGLDALPIDELAKGLPASADEAQNLSEAEQKRWLVVRLASDLRRLAQRGDASVNPIEMLPEWMSDEECYFRQRKSVFETEFCDEPERRARVEGDKEFYEEERAYWDYDGPINAPPPPPK